MSKFKRLLVLLISDKNWICLVTNSVKGGVRLFKNESLRSKYFCAVLNGLGSQPKSWEPSDVLNLTHY